ncbi:hypothetical protein PS1_023252 [Malus domestica]
MCTHGRTWTWRTFQLLPSNASSLASTAAACRTISSQLGFPETTLKPEALRPPQPHLWHLLRKKKSVMSASKCFFLSPRREVGELFTSISSKAFGARQLRSSL